MKSEMQTFTNWHVVLVFCFVISLWYVTSRRNKPSICATMNVIAVFLMEKQNLKWACSCVKEALIWVLSYLFILYVFIFTSPFLVFQKVAIYLAKLSDPDISSMVTGLSAVFHRDFDCYEKKSLHTIVACLRIKGPHISLPELQRAFLQKVVLKKDENGRLVYPELQQTFTRFMGYSFLKWDRNFDITNHVRMYNDDNEVVITRPILTELWEDLMSKPFRKGISPWDAILVENYVADKDEGTHAPDWIILMRVHHGGIGDGFCFENILSSLFDSDYHPEFSSMTTSSKKIETENKKVPTGKTGKQLQNLMMNLQCVAKGPYELVNRGIRFAEDFHALNMPAEKKTHEYFVVESPLISVNEVKQIKQRLGMGFTTVLLGVAAGAVRAFMLKNGLPLPTRYTTTLPFPSSDNRPDKLGNDFLLAAIDLPIHLANQEERMWNVQRSLENLRHSGFMKMLDVFMKMTTSFPSTILRAITKKAMFSMTYSSIPGPPNVVRGGLNGCDFIEANFTHGLAPDSLGFAISTITFAGNLRMTFFVDRCLMEGSREKANMFGECLMQEYAEIKKFTLES